MKYTAKFSLEIKMAEFYLYAILKCSKSEIRKHLKNELFQAWYGIVDGAVQLSIGKDKYLRIYSYLDT
jgi:hypothetical protein